MKNVASGFRQPLNKILFESGRFESKLALFFLDRDGNYVLHALHVSEPSYGPNCND